MSRQPLVLVFCLAAALPLASPATPLSYVNAYGAVETRAGDGLNTAGHYTSGSDTYGSASQPVASGFTGVANARSTGTVSFGAIGPFYPQVAGATVDGSAAFGALHGSATAATQTDRYWYDTYARASSSSDWFDTITFHTSRADGVDFFYALSLIDVLSTTIHPFADPTYFGGLADAKAYTSLAVLRGNQVVDALSITDSVDQRPVMDGYPNGYLDRRLPADRTLSGVVHIHDGDVLSFEQSFYVTAESDNLDSTASALAADTAYFNLRSLDPDGTYTAASGTRYAEVGDPDLGPVVGPAPGGTVPEPQAEGRPRCPVPVGDAHRRMVRDDDDHGRRSNAAVLRDELRDTYTQASNGPVNDNGYASDDQRVGAEYDLHATPGTTQSVASNSTGTVTHGVGGIVTRSTTSAESAGRANFGALHGAARATATVGDVHEQNTTSFARTFSSWYDTLTFRTGVGGADYQYSITLVDTLAATARTAYNQVNADAGVSLSVQGGLPLQLYHSTFNGLAGINTNTLTGYLHVQDGQVVAFYETFVADAFADFATAAASAIADDTAYFNLVGMTDGASYTSDSGTRYVTSGDPDLPVATPPNGTVPEPTSVALMLAGCAAFVARRCERGP